MAVIPEWFREENKDRNIWNPPLDLNLREREIKELAFGLENDWKERDVKGFLKNRAYLFDGLYSHGHGTYAFDEQSLGGTYFADWVIGSCDSGGIFWELVELECPQSKPFLQSGHLSGATRKGVKQITDWIIWIQQNIDYAQRSRSRDGLGLFDLSHHARGVVVVGHRVLYERTPGHIKYNQIRKECNTNDRIEIISYDTLLEKMRFHINRQTNSTSGTVFPSCSKPVT